MKNQIIKIILVFLLLKLYNNENQITLIIKGKNHQNILSDSYNDLLPSEIFVNGEKQQISKKII